MKHFKNKENLKGLCSEHPDTHLLDSASPDILRAFTSRGLCLSILKFLAKKRKTLCCLLFSFCQFEGTVPFQPACYSLSLCWFGEAGGRRCRRMENEHLAFLTDIAKWAVDGARSFEESCAGGPSLQPCIWFCCSE